MDLRRGAEEGDWDLDFGIEVGVGVEVEVEVEALGLVGSGFGRGMVSGEASRACFAASGESKMARMGRKGRVEEFVVSYCLFFELVS